TAGIGTWLAGVSFWLQRCIAVGARDGRPEYLRQQAIQSCQRLGLQRRRVGLLREARHRFHPLGSSRYRSPFEERLDRRHNQGTWRYSEPDRWRARPRADPTCELPSAANVSFYPFLVRGGEVIRSLLKHRSDQIRLLLMLEGARLMR